jgi:multisubunit Na+/H+ antiporter MnhF subunit
MLIGAIKGKNIFERIMCLNCFSSYVIILIALIASFFDHNYIDIAIIYSLISFATTKLFYKINTDKIL